MLKQICYQILYGNPNAEVSVVVTLEVEGEKNENTKTRKTP